MKEKRVFGPFKHKAGTEFYRADLEIYGIDHFKPSYHAQIFFNDADVDIENASLDRESYAGTFAIFGHSECIGDEGHCEINGTPRRFDDRASHPLTRAFKRIVVTDALKRVIPNGDELTITIISESAPDLDVPGERLLDCQGMQLVTFK